MSTSDLNPEVLIVGAGPAGLMAADVLSAAGMRVMIAEAKPSPARKFLMAGKSGLNLTKDESLLAFLEAYGPSHATLHHALSDFGPEDVKSWAASLGQELFTGSTGRVFPKAMKASPLLRAWLTRLDAQKVDLRRNWRLMDMADGYVFDTPEGLQKVEPQFVILAMGGASWARLGSDGAWVAHFEKADLTPFAPSNIGIECDWSPYMAQHFGAPIKGVALSAGDQTTRGECVISERGLEGGGIYMLSRSLREGETLYVDLLPDWDLERIKQTLIQRKKKETTSRFLKRAFKISGAKLGLLNECLRPLPVDLAPVLKALPITNYRLRALDEAISTAGGISFESLTGDLELKSKPSVFAAGEMLDWDAPTGGYLLTACFATGRLAAQGVLNAAARASQGE